MTWGQVIYLIMFCTSLCCNVIAVMGGNDENFCVRGRHNMHLDCVFLGLKTSVTAGRRKKKIRWQ